MKCPKCNAPLGRLQICPCWMNPKRQELVQGPEQHLVVESRSDRQQGDVEEAQPGKRRVDEIVERTELGRLAARMTQEAHEAEAMAYGRDRSRGPEYFEGYRMALVHLLQNVAASAEERSDLIND